MTATQDSDEDLERTLPAGGSGRHSTEPPAALDRSGFRSLYATTARAVHGVLLAHIAPAAADDLLQDVYLIAWKDRAKLEQVEQPIAWLCAVARNLAHKHLRRAGNSREQAESQLDPPDLDQTGMQPAKDTQEPGRGSMILRALRELPEPYNELLGLRLVEGLSGPSIASATGRSHETIRVQLVRGMELLRERLRREGLT